MQKNRFVATALAVVLAATTTPTALFAQQSTSISGTVLEARPDYVIRTRDVATGTITPAIPLGPGGTFSLTNLSTANYMVEVTNPGGAIMCQAGPFDMAAQAVRADVFVNCARRKNTPVAWWLVGAAAAAGITAGVLVNPDVPAPPPAAAPAPAPPASPSR